MATGAAAGCHQPLPAPATLTPPVPNRRYSTVDALPLGSRYGFSVVRLLLASYLGRIASSSVGEHLTGSIAGNGFFIRRAALTASDSTIDVDTDVRVKRVGGHWGRRGADINGPIRLVYDSNNHNLETDLSSLRYDGKSSWIGLTSLGLGAFIGVGFAFIFSQIAENEAAGNVAGFAHDIVSSVNGAIDSLLDQLEVKYSVTPLLNNGGIQDRELFMTGLLHPVRPDFPEEYELGLRYGQLRQAFSPLWTQGFRYHQLRPYLVEPRDEDDSGIRFFVTWRKVPATEYHLYGWSYDACRTWYDRALCEESTCTQRCLTTPWIARWTESTATSTRCGRMRYGSLI